MQNARVGQPAVCSVCSHAPGRVTYTACLQNWWLKYLLVFIRRADLGESIFSADQSWFKIFTWVFPEKRGINMFLLLCLISLHIVIRKTCEVSLLMALPCHVVQLYGYPVVAHLCVGLSARSASNCNLKTLHLSEPHPGKHLCGINQSI